MNKTMNYHVVGLMSGTSLDGVDIALCEFAQNNHEAWSYRLIHAKTKPYDQEWQQQLIEAPNLSGRKLMLLHNKYGYYLGELARNFLVENGLNASLIASHGHTIFHEPDKHLTFQLGNGACIRQNSGISTVCDFRTADVAHGGQGAPLVPFGDKYLFTGYQAWLNLGGFANVTIQNKHVTAYDICPVNTVINHLAQQLGYGFDKDGDLARRGNCHNALLEKLNALPYYALKAPKSLGIEWVNDTIFRLLKAYDNISVYDLLNTFYQHIAYQIALSLPDTAKNMLVSGGGANNKYLIELIQQRTNVKIEIPSPDIINFKESIVFAFLGLCKWLGKINTLATVTGAEKDLSSGVVYP